MELRDYDIEQFTPMQLVSRETINELYDIEDELERQRIKSMLSMRARELKVERDFLLVIKAYDKEEKRLTDRYNKEKSKRNSKIEFDTDTSGKRLSSIENFWLILENDPKFKGLKFNLLSHSPEQEINGKTKKWTDSDDSAARKYIEKKYCIHNVHKLDDALRFVFMENEYHPIRQLIDSFRWDGIERIPTLLCKWLKCEDNPYSREVSRLIFSGGINRLYNPGCKFDDMPVLIGSKQGEGKSTFVRWLAMKDEYFGEVSEIEGQRGIEALEGLWICEVGELLALTRTKEVEAAKSFISRLVDRYRRPFDKRVTDHPRQCVFIGTTNKEQFLTDKTGNRRYYPIRVMQSGYDLFDCKDEIMEDIRNCWAEAKYKYDKGEMLPFADRKLSLQIREQQEKSLEEDYREGLIERYLLGSDSINDKSDRHDEVCVLELWKKALDNPFSKPSKKDSIEIGLILQKLGWENIGNKRIDNYGQQKIWINKNPVIKIGEKELFEDTNLVQ